MKKSIRATLNLIMSSFILVWYVIQYVIPRRKNRWIIGDRYGLKYSDNSKALYEYIISHESSIHIVWITRNNVVYEHLKNRGLKVAYANSFYGIMMSLMAAKVIVDVSLLDINPYFIGGAKIINLTHGAPIKNAGYADHQRPKSKFLDYYFKCFPFRNESLAHFVISTADFFDLYWPLEFNNFKINIISAGYPRNDIFFANKTGTIEAIQLIKNKFPPGNQVVMYLPTFRGDASFFAPFEQFEFNPDLFMQCLERNKLIFLIKAHPGQKSKLSFEKYDRIIEIDDTPLTDANELLNEVDILVTDYSGAYFDFLVSGRPIILAPFDYLDYIENSRSLYVDYFADIEGTKAYSWLDMINVLDHKSYYVPSVAVARKFNRDLGENCSEKVCKYIKLI